MKRRYAIVLGLALGVIGSIAGFATVARTAPEAQPYGPPIGPRMPQDTGPGEVLIAVVGGVYPSRQEADAANEAMVFGDLQGYYVVPVGQFGGFSEQLASSGGPSNEVGSPGDFALVSVFRTEEGAQEFVDLASSFGHPATILSERVHSFGGAYAGLGQEAHPDGTGPLLGPISESLPGPETAS
jgi:hypothetical protein